MRGVFTRRPRAPTRVAGTKKTALFDIVSWDDGQRPTANGSRASRDAAHVKSRTHSRVPGERSETPISGLPEIGS
jgi:hypothetical protein